MKQRINCKKDTFEVPRLIAAGKFAHVDAAKCSRRMSGKAKCSIRPNTN